MRREYQAGGETFRAEDEEAIYSHKTKDQKIIAKGKGEGMLSRSRILITSVVLTAFVFCNVGCAALWFLAGAGTAAAVGTVVAQTEKNDDDGNDVVDK